MCIAEPQTRTGTTGLQPKKKRMKALPELYPTLSLVILRTDGRTKNENLNNNKKRAAQASFFFTQGKGVQ